ncbi:MULTISPECIES: RNA polymerase recycling motor HelD [Clostridium]|uniref:DNA 3'-5' helicase n=1 Tax=Clostridium faecium TaxID=2762223 RepID=A0ABR8YQI8_9CLOT|nr:MULTISPECIES: RNA polymerase recycling motor HelD [Clostridium]MBD8046529.1 UvrD-helicase domain-containing protein [Clostridium faecium]MDU1349157.1 RNA polymerase recycling motor HelD [Clostridium argentinense]
MVKSNHPDYDEEVLRLNTILEYLIDYNKNILKEKKELDEAVNYGYSHYNSDNAEQFNELVINTALQRNLESRVRGLEKSIEKPYFARVDFKEEGKENIQRLYIGKTSLVDDKSNELLIVDWRAPIATLYYEGRLGEAKYDCEDGVIGGNISLKRQYAIEKSKLIDIYDIDITTNDEFLQASLNSLKDNRLKDIVSTIQEEQNRVIRADMWKPLIVQGAAGGGKTTIALHRIAYLLYNYEKTLSPDNFMIIAPNRFFLSYISDVLPELGVDNVKQNTFEDFALEFIEEDVAIIDPSIKLRNIIEGNKNIFKVTSFKTSIEFKKLIDRFISHVESTYIPKLDFKVNDTILYSYKEIVELFKNDYSYLPFEKRINEIRKHFINKTKRDKQKILDKIEYDYEDKLNEIRWSSKDSPKRRAKIIEIADERDELLKRVKNKLSSLVRDYFKNIKPLSLIDYYKEFILSLMKWKPDGIIGELTKETLKNIENNLVEIEDLAPLMYIKLKVFGVGESLNLKHIVIDEAQDFSLLQFHVLKEILGSGSMTILGDICQGIYSYRGTNDWNLVNNCIFEEEAQMLVLEQSYRTTIEIMNGATEVLKALKDEKLPTAKPVIRHGEEIAINSMKDYHALALQLKSDIDENKSKGYKSLALICKTLEECKRLKTELDKEEIEVNLIEGGEDNFTGGVVLIPSYLVKGLEFDMVIICNASKENYSENQLDVKLLYVAMTRPLHNLKIYYIGEKTKLLKSDFFKR